MTDTASGLYYLSELVEEHTVLTKYLLQRLIYFVVALQTLLCLVDSFPVKLSLLSIFSHVIYAQNLRRFPVVKLTDPLFILSCGMFEGREMCKEPQLIEIVLVLVNHYLWFTHFQAPPRYRPDSSYNGYAYDTTEHPSFSEISSYFGLCVWLVPFALFVGLSAGENVLPSMGSEYATGNGSSFVAAGSEPGKKEQSREGLAKALVNNVRDWVGGAGEALGMSKSDDTKRW